MRSAALIAQRLSFAYSPNIIPPHACPGYVSEVGNVNLEGIEEKNQ
jgi:hypothetical protein